jgi:hypothetical protein
MVRNSTEERRSQQRCGESLKSLRVENMSQASKFTACRKPHYSVGVAGNPALVVSKHDPKNKHAGNFLFLPSVAPQ